ncbi:MAG TPA: hypothetical protein VGN34_09090, partial [Ktedonobacteraceae bacterium]
MLALTRIFLADPGLVILDEASSRLDPATEQLLERAVDKLLHNRMAIIIAHRLTTVRPLPEVPYQAKTTEHHLQSLEAKGLTYHYPGTNHGINQVDLFLPRGSFTVVTGRIGSGKTT